MSDGYNDIQHLGGLAHVRARPGMYAGSTQENEYGSALMNGVREIVGNSADEAVDGGATDIWVTLDTTRNRISVRDNGRGMPFGLTTIENPLVKGQQITLDKLELATSVMNTGAKYDKGDGKAFKFSAGLNGVGVKWVNGTAVYFHVLTVRPEGARAITCSQGNVTEPVHEVTVNGHARGTTVTWEPDPEILPFHYNQAHLRRYLHEVAYLNAGLRVHLTIDEAPETLYAEPDGILAMLRAVLGTTETLLTFPLLLGESTNRPAHLYEIALAVTAGGGEAFYPFVNGGAIENASTPVVALRQVFARTMQAYLKDHYTLPKKYAKLEIRPDDFRAGLYAVLRLKHEDPSFDSQTKTKLTNTDLSSLIATTLGDQLLAHLLKNPQAADRIIAQAITNAEAREAAAKARAKVLDEAGRRERQDLAVSLDIYQPPLADDPDRNVLYLFEGGSAAGSLVWAAKATDPATGQLYKQHVGILALRGMVFNAALETLARAMQNVELATLVKVAGLNPQQPDDLSGCNFKYFYITTDMDAGGHHIATLLVSFFLAHFPEVIRQGRLHRVITPLFELHDLKQKQLHFIYPEQARTAEQLAQTIKQLGFDLAEVNRRFTIKRNKGLGELSNPGKMTLVQNPRTIPYAAPTPEALDRLRRLYRVFSGDDTIEQRRAMILAHGLTRESDEAADLP